jgi:hypothetical protein
LYYYEDNYLNLLQQLSNLCKEKKCNSNKKAVDIITRIDNIIMTIDNLHDAFILHVTNYGSESEKEICGKICINFVKNTDKYSARSKLFEYDDNLDIVRQTDLKKYINDDAEKGYYIW